MNTIVSLFTQLVTIDSPSGYEKNISEFLISWLKKNKFSYKVDSVGNILANNNKLGHPLLLCAHMDTVEPGKNIKPQIKKGLIKSSGNTILGADNKASIAAIMTAVEKNNSRHLEILFTVKEETESGIEQLPFAWIKSRRALVFDRSKPLGGIVLRSPYISNFKITVKGKAAHASIPEKGKNAFTPAIAGLSLIPTGTLNGGETTINIGLLRGGIGINTIPDFVEIKGEVRSYNKLYLKKHLDNIKNIMENQAKNTGTVIQFSLDAYCPGYTHKKNDQFIDKLTSMYKSLGLNPIYYEYSGVSDANILNAQGIKTINLTDGTKNSHTALEKIAVKDLVMLADIVTACISKL